MKVLSLLAASIGESELTSALTQKIDDAGEVVSKVTKLDNQWTVKIQEDEFITGMGLMLYEDWDSSTAYAVDDMV